MIVLNRTRVIRILSWPILVILITSCAGRKLSYSPVPFLPKTEIVLQSSPSAYTKEGLVHFKAGEYEEAVLWFKKAIQTDPNYQPAYAWLGAAYIYLGEKEKAKRELEWTISIDPNTTDAQAAKKWFQRLENPTTLMILKVKNKGRYYSQHLEEDATLALIRYIRETGMYQVVDGSQWDYSNPHSSWLLQKAREKGADLIVQGEIEYIQEYSPTVIQTNLGNYNLLSPIKIKASLAVYKARNGVLVDTFTKEKVASMAVRRTANPPEKLMENCLEELVKEFQRNII